MALDRAEPGLFVTALYPSATHSLAHPAWLGEAVASPGHPFVAEGTGWKAFYEPEALAPLEQDAAQLSESRARAICRVLDETAWDAVVYVSTVTDRVQHAFWKFREPDLYRKLPLLHPHVATSTLYSSHAPTPEQVSRFGDTIDRCYEAMDRWFGEIVGRADPSTLIVVLSDHGAKGGVNRVAPTAGVHHEDGIYVVVGPTIPPDRATGPQLRQVDVLPLILAHLGLPSETSMPGRVPAELAPRDKGGAPLPLPAPVASFDVARRNKDAGEIDEATRSQLRSLGYIE
jgi:hypothetical protein